MLGTRMRLRCAWVCSWVKTFQFTPDGNFKERNSTSEFANGVNTVTEAPSTGTYVQDGVGTIVLTIKQRGLGGGADPALVDVPEEKITVKMDKFAEHECGNTTIEWEGQKLKGT